MPDKVEICDIYKVLAKKMSETWLAEIDCEFSVCLILAVIGATY